MNAFTVTKLREELERLEREGHGPKEIQTYTPQYGYDVEPYGEPDAVYLEGDKVELS